VIRELQGMSANRVGGEEIVGHFSAAADGDQD
jgi:hypothetical protein